MPLSISVVIPTYNRSAVVAMAVQSALAQSLAVHEVVVVDDGSTPPLSQDDLGRVDRRVRILRQEKNRGAAAARQAGVDASTGEAVAFLDSDDLWLPGKLKAQAPLLEAAMVAGRLSAITCGWEARPERGGAARWRIPIPSADIADFASGCWFNPGSTVVLPKRAFDMVGSFDVSLRRLEDLDWFLRFAVAGGRLEVAPVLGAVISTGRRGRCQPVEDAACAILARFTGSGHALIGPSALRRLRAYLDLERAAAARNEGQWIKMAALLAKSFTATPRVTVPLRRWWWN
jgi:glycosyltransferase involved in cell wall biosynthesis